MKEFFTDHFDTIITIAITIVGFVVTYFGTRRSFKNEIAQVQKINVQNNCLWK